MKSLFKKKQKSKKQPFVSKYHYCLKKSGFNSFFGKANVWTISVPLTFQSVYLSSLHASIFRYCFCKRRYKSFCMFSFQNCTHLEVVLKSFNEYSWKKALQDPLGEWLKTYTTLCDFNDKIKTPLPYAVYIIHTHASLLPKLVIAVREYGWHFLSMHCNFHTFFSLSLWISLLYKDPWIRTYWDRPPVS